MIVMLNDLFRFNYLKKYQLDGLKKYKYSAVDSSPLSKYVMHPFWNTLVKLFPLWIAPNLMTFAGFLLLVSGYCIVAIHDFDFKLPLRVPREDEHGLGAVFCRPVWITMLLLQLISHTLDGLDGKQARRTQSSSALGELFDHGLDSWACGFFPVPFFSVVSLVEPYGLTTLEMHFFLWLIYFSFFLSHWEKYNTGILYLPWSYDLSMLLLALCYFLVSIFTPELFQFHVPIIGITFSRTVLGIIAGSVMFLSLPLSVWNVLRSFNEGTQIWPNKLEALRPISSMIALLLTSTYWISYSKNDVASLQPRTFYLAIATTFSNLVTKCKPFNLSLIPYIMVVIVSTCSGSIMHISARAEIIILNSYTIYILLAHIHYGTCTVRQIAKHLQISVFHVQERQNNG